MNKKATNSDFSGTSLLGYGRDAYQRCHFTCVYCGFDGRAFDSWMQLSVDHLRPRSSGGNDDPKNLVAACRSCNSITSRMQFDRTETLEQILDKKRTRVIERRREFYKEWLEEVAPHILDRPLPGVLDLGENGSSCRG